LNDNVHRYQRSNNSSIPDVVFALLIANGLMFALQWMFPQIIERWLILFSLNASQYWSGAQFWPWQLLTYGFLHSRDTLAHLAFNMLALWMFGREIERLMGSRRFLIYWVVCVVGAGLIQLLVSVVTGVPSATLGASGGVFGLLLAFALAFPNRMIVLLIPPIPMKAKYFVLIYGLITLYMGFSGSGSGVAHFAHLGGMLFGYILIRYWSNPKPRR
jgi:membrane associated rhomboid family serine protease